MRVRRTSIQGRQAHRKVGALAVLLLLVVPGIAWCHECVFGVCSQPGGFVRGADSHPSRGAATDSRMAEHCDQRSDPAEVSLGLAASGPKAELTDNCCSAESPAVSGELARAGSGGYDPLITEGPRAKLEEFARTAVLLNLQAGLANPGPPLFRLHGALLL